MNVTHIRMYYVHTHYMYVHTFKSILIKNSIKKYKTSIDPFNMYLFKHSNLIFAYYMQLLLYVDNDEDALCMRF